MFVPLCVFLYVCECGHVFAHMCSVCVCLGVCVCLYVIVCL